MILPSNCPICGKQPHKKHELLDERYGYAERITYKCLDCGCTRHATGDTSKPGYTDNSKVEAQALSAWEALCNKGRTK